MAWGPSGNEGVGFWPADELNGSVADDGHCVHECVGDFCLCFYPSIWKGEDMGMYFDVYSAVLDVCLDRSNTLEKRVEICYLSWRLILST